MTLKFVDDHPRLAISDYAMSNWYQWCDRHLTHPREYAADSALKPRSSTLGLKRPIGRTPELKDFEEGGRYDYYGRRGSRMAHDAAGEEPIKAKGGISGVLRRLGAACTPEEWENFRKILTGEGDGASDCTSDIPTGEPERKTAMDAASRFAFDAMYPNSRPVRRVDFAPQPERGAKPVTQESERAFFEMFPGARPLKRV